MSGNKIKFTKEQIRSHRDFLEEKVFQTHKKWPHFKLLLDDIQEIQKRLTPNSNIVCLERGLLYGGLSLISPLLNGHNVISVDCSPESAETRGAYNASMVQDARCLNSKTTLRNSIYNIDVDTGAADLVIIPNLVHHIQNQEQMFNEAKRILKKGGELYIFEPLVRELHQIPDDFLRYTPYGLQSKMEALKFDQIRIKKNGGPFTAVLYCWIQAIEYIPKEERKDIEEWLYEKENIKLIEWDKKYTKNLERENTEFPMGFSLTCTKN